MLSSRNRKLKQLSIQTQFETIRMANSTCCRWVVAGNATFVPQMTASDVWGRNRMQTVPLSATVADDWSRFHSLSNLGLKTSKWAILFFSFILVFPGEEVWMAIVTSVNGKPDAGNKTVNSGDSMKNFVCNHWKFYQRNPSKGISRFQLKFSSLDKEFKILVSHFKMLFKCTAWKTAEDCISNTANDI